jgi:uncharacterized protein YjeT (DUF2065 family)
MDEFVTALGLVLVIEGLAYALFPAVLQRMMAAALQLPENMLRTGGLAIMATGVFVIWLLRG